MDKIYTCPECGKRFEGISAFSNHINEEKTKIEEVKKATELQARIASLKSDMNKYINRLQAIMAEFNSLSKEEKAELNFQFKRVSVNGKTQAKTEKTGNEKEVKIDGLFSDAIRDYIASLW